MNHSKSCCLIGQPHHELSFGLNESEEKCVFLKKCLAASLETQIAEQHVTRFLCGMSLGIPMYAAEIILKLKKFHPEITLECFIPFEELTTTWPESLRDRFFHTVEHCDKEVMLQTHYTPDCEKNCIRRMIDESDQVVAAYTFLSEETDAHLQYAAERKKAVIHIAPFVTEAV